MGLFLEIVGDSKLIVSMSLGFSALFRWKPGPSLDSEAGSCWHHGDLLVMDGCCQDEYLHCTDPMLEGERVVLTFRWIRNHLFQCPLGGGVGCCLPTCALGSSVSASARCNWLGLVFWGLLWVLLVWGLHAFAASILVSTLVAGAHCAQDMPVGQRSVPVLFPFTCGGFG